MNHILGYKCRICLSENISGLFNLRSPVDICDEITYLECYQECTQLEVSTDDLLPQTICCQCAEQIRDAYFFIKRAKEAHQMLLMKQELILKSDEYQDSRKQADFEWVGVQKEEDAIPAIKLSPSPNLPSEEKIEDYQDDYKEHIDDSEFVPKECESPVSGVIETTIDVIGEPLQKKKRGRPRIIEMLTEEELHTQTRCEFCDETVLKKDLKRHIAARKHKRPMLLCHACPRTFKDVTSLRTHAETHEENRPRNYNCDHCERRFFTKTSFVSHMRIHDTNRELYECQECDKTFFHKGSLRLHMKRHLGATLECTICSKKYVRGIDLKIHMRSHSGDMPFRCHYCDKSFPQMGSLNKHMRQHEGYRYKCDICGKEYVHQSTLITHRKEHTGIPFKCGVCGKAFAKSSKIKRHIAGVHKIMQPEDMEDLIIKVKTKRIYRARVLQTCL